MSDIHELASAIVAQSAAHRALINCDAVRKYIQHKQIDGGYGEMIDQAPLITVSQHTLPDGKPVYLAVFFTGLLFVHMLLAEQDGGYVKLSPDACWGNVPTVGASE